MGLLVCVCAPGDAFCLLLCPPCSGQDSPSPVDPILLVDVLFDLSINVDDKLLSLWLPGRKGLLGVPSGPAAPCLCFSPVWLHLLFTSGCQKRARHAVAIK